jgi:hypothetical protein
MEQTYGQKAVGLSFNPSNDDAVTRCKQMYADIIDQLDAIASRSVSATGEQQRLAKVAITQAQGAQMWAVKALTWRD